MILQLCIPVWLHTYSLLMRIASSEKNPKICMGFNGKVTIYDPITLTPYLQLQVWDIACVKTVWFSGGEGPANSHKFKLFASAAGKSAAPINFVTSSNPSHDNICRSNCIMCWNVTVMPIPLQLHNWLITESCYCWRSAWWLLFKEILLASYCRTKAVVAWVRRKAPFSTAELSCALIW